MTRLFAPHPMNTNVAWATCFYVEPIGNSIFFIHDATSGNGMSVTNNMENVLCSICYHFHIWEDRLHKDYTIYVVEDAEPAIGTNGAVYRIDHEGCTNPRWIYMGPDDKALRVLYGA